MSTVIVHAKLKMQVRKPFLEHRNCLVLFSFEFCCIFCDVMHIRILFIKLHLQYVELFVSLMKNGFSDCATEYTVCLHHSKEKRESTDKYLLVSRVVPLKQ